MLGQYILFYGNGMNWVWMLIMMLGSVGWIILLVALWKIMQAKQSIARSMEEITKKMGTNRLDSKIF